MLIRPILATLCLFQAACVVVPATTPVVESGTSTSQTETTVATATVSAEDIAQLRQQLAQLQQQVNLLQQQQTGLSQSISLLGNRRTATRVPVVNTGGANPAPPVAKRSAYEQAWAQYQQKQYPQAIRSLAPYAGGGDGSAEAQNGMYLLLLAHQRLANCDSVIHTGQQFARRFSQNNNAANALYMVAQCQNRIQQKDIARDTLRRLVQSYPNSTAAQQARALLP